MMDLQRDLEDKIKAHPMIAVALAMGAGAVIAFARGSSRRTAAPAKRTVRGMIFGGLSTIAIGMIRTAVLEHLSEAARGWLDPDRESTASRDRSVESFLEHEARAPRCHRRDAAHPVRVSRGR